MTTIYDPHHPDYLDDADLREELTRVFDLCHGCRLCSQPLQSAFPTLFELIDRHDDQDAGRLTRAEQDQVVDECFQCKLCYVNCPYIPGPERAGDRLPAADAAGRSDPPRDGRGPAGGPRSPPTSWPAPTCWASSGVGRPPLANAATAKPGSLVRKVMEKATGVSSVRLLPPFARQRFTTWFRKRPRVRLPGRQGKVAIFPTCLVEYHEPGHRPRPGEGLRAQRHRVLASRTAPAAVGRRGCTAATSTTSRRSRSRTSRRWRPPCKAGNDIVVPQPTCSYVLRKDYPDYVGGPDADAGGRPHLRRLRVPHAAAQGRGHRARHGLPGRRAGRDRLSRAVPPPGAEHRPEEPRSA